MADTTIIVKGIIDVDIAPLNPQKIGGIADGDGDCGHVEPIESPLIS